MTKAELIAALEPFSDSEQVMILDGFNGGGNPREINHGPQKRIVTEADADDAADCEELIGKQVIILGYGFY
jgi:hypothetical protein